MTSAETNFHRQTLIQLYIGLGLILFNVKKCKPRSINQLVLDLDDILEKYFSTITY